MKSSPLRTPALWSTPDAHLGSLARARNKTHVLELACDQVLALLHLGHGVGGPELTGPRSGASGEVQDARGVQQLRDGLHIEAAEGVLPTGRRCRVVRGGDSCGSVRSPGCGAGVLGRMVGHGTTGG
jgi:hypothetical protein